MKRSVSRRGCLEQVGDEIGEDDRENHNCDVSFFKI